MFFETDQYSDLNNDQMVGLIHVLGMLRERDQDIIRYRFEEHLTYKSEHKTILQSEVGHHEKDYNSERSNPAR